MNKIFNVGASNCFVEVLATKLLKDYENNDLEMANVVVLLPNRRACRSLAEAFVRKKGLSSTILPQMKALGDVNEEELLLIGSGAAEGVVDLPPTIETTERMLLFTKLIEKRYEEFGLEKISLAQACSLAQELGNLIDSAEMYGLEWSRLDGLVPEEYASHWQETLRFLKIVTAYWPEILRERGVIDAAKRRNVLIEKQSNMWQKQKPKTRIIVAGSTAVSPVMKKMVKTVLDLPNGEVWLAGLDKYSDEDDWEKIDESHPQFELKQLLEYLNIKRENVVDAVVPQNEKREHFISEIMRPAQTTNKWRDVKKVLDEDALIGVELSEYDDQRKEAKSISLIIRNALEEKGKTIALVTPDRTLARKVAAELQTWDIEVDDSAGVPLGQSPWGIFMRLIAEAFFEKDNKTNLLALMKNNLFALGNEKSFVCDAVQKIDKNLWRLGEDDEEAQNLLQKIEEASEMFVSLLNLKKCAFSDLLREHILLAEKLAETASSKGEEMLWLGDDGEAGANFLSELINNADVLGEINTKEYLPLIEVLMSGIMVRKKHDTHRRIKILGPMESRLNQFDEIILGSFNEGVWPASPVADPWMSRPMKKEFGFELPEKQIGVLGLDFANLLGAKKVYLTRAKKNGGAPTVKSRWWMRIETVMQAMECPFENRNEFERVVGELERPEKEENVAIPCPKPPLKYRPRKFSASGFEKLLRDPYGVYAEYILKLKPLEDLDKEEDARDFGNMLHDILEKFGKLYARKLPDNVEEILQKMGKEALEKAHFSKEKTVFWEPKLRKMLSWFANEEIVYRDDVCRVNNEVWGRIFLDGFAGGKVELFAKADRIDETVDGKINIIDFKSGSARTQTEVKKGYAPQLPIEGIIAREGGFEGIKSAEVDSLMYWKLADKVVKISGETDAILDNTLKNIREAVDAFDDVENGYLSRPNPRALPEYSDYEHLARVKEWSVKEDGGEG